MKIFSEGITEWHYFDTLRAIKRFNFSMEPAIPQNGKSSYKQNLILMDRELKKNPQERADAIFLVIDTDTITKDNKQYAQYLQTKAKYEKMGVSFIESYPCIEIWFLYHLMEKFGQTSYQVYEDVLTPLKKVLAGYEKTERYYRSNRTFAKEIMLSQENRNRAIANSIKACKYKPVEGEVHNYTRIHEVIRLFRMLQCVNNIKAAISENMRIPVSLKPTRDANGAMKVTINANSEQLSLCLLKCDNQQLKCIINSTGEVFDLNDSVTIDYHSHLIEILSKTLRTANK
ncbi:MAG: RloB family protein [Prevotella sp.]|nr:RloB family protein [Prevotella sp.]